MKEISFSWIVLIGVDFQGHTEEMAVKISINGSITESMQLLLQYQDGMITMAEFIKETNIMKFIPGNWVSFRIGSSL